jgi:hypothetical protein
VLLTCAEGIFAGAALDVFEADGVTEIGTLLRVEMLIATVVDIVASKECCIDHKKFVVMALELESVSKEELAEASPETPLETAEGKSADSWLFVERETPVDLLKSSSELINSTVEKALKVDSLADELMIELAKWALHDATVNKDSFATLALKVIERLAEQFVAEI